MTSLTSDSGAPQKVAAIICAHNVGRDIASTVRSCRAIPGVDLLIVIDDGSDDDTGKAARAAGAVVVRHSVERGRASAMETGVKVAAMRDRVDAPPRLLLFLSADLGESCVDAALLVDAVVSGMADCAVAAPPAGAERPRSLAENMARGVIRRATGWEPTSPLSEQRCLTRDALNAIMPFANGYGLELAMTTQLLAQGYSMIELSCSFTHTGADRVVGELNQTSRLADTALAAGWLLLRRVRLPRRWRGGSLTLPVPVAVGLPYPRPATESAEAKDALRVDE